MGRKKRDTLSIMLQATYCTANIHVRRSRSVVRSECFSGGGDVYSCNPITNAGCDGATVFVCDADLLNGAFICTNHNAIYRYVL